MARVLITAGFVLVGVGVLVGIGVPIGRLPGDIAIRRGNTSVYFPIVTCIVVSVLLSVVAAIFRR